MYIFPLKNLDNFTPLAHYVHFSMIWFIKKDKIERLNLYRDKIITSTFLLFSLRMLFTFLCENNFLIQYMINLNIKHITSWTITKKKFHHHLIKISNIVTYTFHATCLITVVFYVLIVSHK